MTIRFHLDESVTTVLADALRQRGIDVTTTVDASLIGATDEAHLEFARQQHRVVVTHDVDYLRLHQSGAEHAGIVYCQQSKYAVRELLQMLLLVHTCYTAEQMDGRVEYIGSRSGYRPEVVTGFVGRRAAVQLRRDGQNQALNRRTRRSQRKALTGSTGWTGCRLEQKSVEGREDENGQFNRG